MVSVYFSVSYYLPLHILDALSCLKELILLCSVLLLFTVIVLGFFIIVNSFHLPTLDTLIYILLIISKHTTG